MILRLEGHGDDESRRPNSQRTGLTPLRGDACIFHMVCSLATSPLRSVFALCTALVMFLSGLAPACCATPLASESASCAAIEEMTSRPTASTILSSPCCPESPEAPSPLDEHSTCACPCHARVLVPVAHGMYWFSSIPEASPMPLSDDQVSDAPVAGIDRPPRNLA